MTKLRISSKMHLFIVISCIVAALGLAVGLICHFVSDGFFNWGGEYGSYQKIEVTYRFDMDEDEVEAICEDAFEANGVSYYTKTYSNNGASEYYIEYRFLSSVDGDALAAAADAIVEAAEGYDWYDWSIFSASSSEVETVIGGGRDLMYVGIALAAAVVFQFLYFLIRYKLTMAIAAFVADLHNLVIFLALLAITRVQVTFTVIALGVFVVLLTMIACGIIFDKMRKNFRTDEYKAMSSFEQSDAAAAESFRLVTIINGCIAAAFAVILVFTAIGALSVYGLFMPCICGIIAALVCEYGCMFFVPSIYSRLKQRSDDYAVKKASRYVGAKKSANAAE